MTTSPPQHYYYGVGRRKEAVARVRLYPGAGAVVVNGKPAEEFFTREVQRREFLEPLAVTEMEGRFNAQVKCSGGGRSGWAGAIRPGHRPRPDRGRRRPAPHPQARRHADPRRTHQGTQEARPQARAQGPAVHQALSRPPRAA